MKWCAATTLAPESEPGQRFKQHCSRSACSQHKLHDPAQVCDTARDAPGVSLTPGEATAEDPTVCEDAEPDLAGCVHAVGIHPKVVYEALHLNLQMHLGNSVLHSQLGARSSEHGSERRGRIVRGMLPLAARRANCMLRQISKGNSLGSMAACVLACSMCCMQRQ